VNAMIDELPAKLAAVGVDPCDDGTHNHDWRRAELGCEDCGDHFGFICDTCLLGVDAVWNTEAYNLIDAAIPSA
jgi:hypothetical protein